MINHWTFRCKDVSALISRGLDSRLPLPRRVGIRFHLMMCRFCREYKRQLELIHLALKRLDPPENDSVDLVPLPEDARQRILNRMQLPADPLAGKDS